MTKISNFPILPNEENVIGIIGGGQLGKMIALSASKAGYKTHLYCPKGDNPAEAVVDKMIKRFDGSIGRTGFAVGGLEPDRKRELIEKLRLSDG